MQHDLNHVAITDAETEPFTEKAGRFINTSRSVVTICRTSCIRLKQIYKRLTFFGLIRAPYD